MKIYHYKILFYDGTEELLSYELGMRVDYILASGKAPRFLRINDDTTIATSDIRRLKREKSLVMSKDYKHKVHEDRELTQGEKKAKEALNSITNLKQII